MVYEGGVPEGGMYEGFASLISSTNCLVVFSSALRRRISDWSTSIDACMLAMSCSVDSREGEELSRLVGRKADSREGGWFSIPVGKKAGAFTFIGDEVAAGRSEQNRR